MIISAWPYILRLALATYFLSSHLPALLDGFKNVAIDKGSMFSCVEGLMPTIVAYNIWHGFFALLALAIILWRKPVSFLGLSLVILIIQLYIDFANQINSTSSVLTLISILINITLLIVYGRLRSY